MNQLAFVALGGALGSVCRWAISKLYIIEQGVSFPWPTFLVNISGSFLIGLCIHLFEKNIINQQFQWLLVTGFLGGFSTFSAFGLELFQFIRNGNLYMGAIYAVLSVLVGLLFVYFGYKVIDLVKA